MINSEQKVRFLFRNVRTCFLCGKKTILCIDFIEVSFWLILIGIGACPVTLVLWRWTRHSHKEICFCMLAGGLNAIVSASCFLLAVPSQPLLQVYECMASCLSNLAYGPLSKLHRAQEQSVNDGGWWREQNDF
jgi:hypothetical protein